MNKQILASVVGDDKPISLLIAEPLYRTSCQSNLPFAPYGAIPGNSLFTGMRTDRRGKKACSHLNSLIKPARPPKVKKIREPGSHHFSKEGCGQGTEYRFSQGSTQNAENRICCVFPLFERKSPNQGETDGEGEIFPDPAVHLNAPAVTRDRCPDEGKTEMRGGLSTFPGAAGCGDVPQVCPSRRKPLSSHALGTASIA